MKRLFLISSIVVGLLACKSDDDAGSGTLKLKASGEEAAVSGYPVGSGDDEIAFKDDWTLEFDKVVASVTDFQLRTQGGGDAMVDADPVVFDLHQGEPDLWAFEDVPAKRWDRVGYRFRVPNNKVRIVGDVNEDDVQKMKDEGYSLLVGGTAMKDDQEVQFEYGFPFEIEMDECHSGLDDTDGVVVPANAVAEAQITIHLDHLFFDSWAIEEPDLRFDAMAAMAPADGPLTLDDLAAQDNLSDLVDTDGKPLDVAYDPGSTFDPVPDNLRDYVISAATTTGHFNGEGHCEYTRTK